MTTPLQGIETPLEPTEVEASAPALKGFPDHFIPLSEEAEQALSSWLDSQIERLESAQSANRELWKKYETAYRAYQEEDKLVPFAGASVIVVPVIAMAVDPIHARLDTGIWKQDPPITLKALRKDIEKYIPSVQKFLNYWINHVAKLRRVASPQTLECVKLGTTAFKVVYDRREYTIKTYDPRNNYAVVTRTELRYAGPRVLGVDIERLLFPPGVQFLQDCDIVMERQRVSYGELKIAEASGRLTNVSKIKGQGTVERQPVESVRMEVAGHQESHHTDPTDTPTVYEIWCDYDINGDEIPEHLVITYHRPTRTYLQRRYNWYFHQEKPYVIIPYSIANGTLYGVGQCEMVIPFQQAITKWEQMAEDNAYLANIRMFIAKEGADQIESPPKLYAGRVFRVNDPKTDFIPFQASDIYPSTLQERQNLFGLVEKRTGVSDYLTGRESPIIGTRATATSTLALIQEGTKRVEEVLENFRDGFGEILLKCFSIWIQYGLEGLDEMVFGDDTEKVRRDVVEFFDVLHQTTLTGAVSIDLTATDASGNRAALQSMQLQLIQIMMGYYEKLLQAMGAAMQLMQTQPEMAAVIKETMTASRKLYEKLLHDYNIRNPEDYLPDIERYINGGQDANAGPLGRGAAPSGVGGPQGQPRIPGVPGPFGAIEVPRPGTPGSGQGPNGGFPPPGAGTGF